MQGGIGEVSIRGDRDVCVLAVGLGLKGLHTRGLGGNTLLGSQVELLTTTCTALPCNAFKLQVVISAY